MIKTEVPPEFERLMVSLKDYPLDILKKVFLALYQDTKLEKEVWRIKSCPRCKKYYWAQRSDNLACSKECGSVIRVRKARGSKLFNHINNEATAI